MPPAEPAASRAVLIGVSRYEKMDADRQLPAVERNLERLAALLTDDRVWGLPPGHLTVVHQPEDAAAVIDAVRTAAKAATGALLVYYAGHGLTDPLTGGGLHLALPASYEPGGTHLALDYGHVRTALLREAAAVPQKVVVLDCCWSALAIPGGMGGTSGGTVLANAAAIEGTAVLTACAATQQARSPQGETYTAFTGALIDLLSAGVPGAGDTLDVATLYGQLTARLGSRGMPAPQLGCTGAGSGIAFAHNVAAQHSAEHAKPAEPATSAATMATLRPSAADLRRRSRDSLRMGEYGRAAHLLRRAAAAGDRESVHELVAELRRTGHYVAAADLEQADPAALDTLITDLESAGIV